MNAAIRFVAGLRPPDHVSSARRDLHWLPIEQRIVYKLCVMMHAVAVHIGTAPEYIRDLVTPVGYLTLDDEPIYDRLQRVFTMYTPDENTHRLEGFFCCRS